MKKALIIIAALLAVAVAGTAAFATWYMSRFSADPVAHSVELQSKRLLASGEVMGFLDNGSFAWLGIPYAEPPVGELRWRAPQPVKPWQVPRAAVEFGHKCPQAMFGGEVEGSEDCLYLNVWAPMEVSSPKPVMLFIHGGGNHMGEAATSIYRGSRFAREQDVVLVSINYRLGPLGWFRHPALRRSVPTLSSDTPSAEQKLLASQAQADNSGNFATLDIIQSLQWVQTNIAEFGGDPTNVTIFGESAGGFNVLSLMVSPLATGLYHKAIVQSGGMTLLSPAEAENYKDAADPGHSMSSRELFNRMLVATEQASSRVEAKAMQEALSLEQTATRLRALTPEQLLSAQYSELPDELGDSSAEVQTEAQTEVQTGVSAEQPDEDEASAFVLGEGAPQQTPYIFGDGYVLPANAQLDSLFADSSTYNATPVILGSNRDETRLFLAARPGYTQRFLGMPLRVADKQQYERDSYYGSNLWKADAVDELANLLQANQAGTVYAYRFDWDEFRSVLLLDVKTLLGAAHALELPFVFGNFDLVNKTLLFKDGAARKKLSQAMMSYWAQFAHAGDPGQGRTGDLPSWGPWVVGTTASSSADLAENNRVLLLDSENDKGIRMAPDLVTRGTLAKELAADQRFTEPQRCRLAKRMFTGRYSDSPTSVSASCR